MFKSGPAIPSCVTCTSHLASLCLSFPMCNIETKMEGITRWLGAINELVSVCLLIRSPPQVFVKSACPGRNYRQASQTRPHSSWDEPHSLKNSGLQRHDFSIPTWD